MARGSSTKEKMYEVLKQVFGDRIFKLDKEIRVNCVEDSQPLQIKITLTAAKDIVGAGSAGAVSAPTATELQPLTDEEIRDVKALIEKLGL